jgi:hypothetical protein
VSVGGGDDLGRDRSGAAAESRTPSAGWQRQRRAKLRLVRVSGEPRPLFAMSRRLAQAVSVAGLLCLSAAYIARILLAGADLPLWLLVLNLAALPLIFVMFVDSRSPYRERPVPLDEREQADRLRTIELSWRLMLGLLFVLYIVLSAARWNGWTPGRYIVSDLLLLITQTVLVLPIAVAAWREPAPLHDDELDPTDSDHRQALTPVHRVVHDQMAPQPTGEA